MLTAEQVQAWYDESRSMSVSYCEEVHAELIELRRRTDIVAKCAALGIDHQRLKSVLDVPENWGHLVNAFEVITVLSVVCDAMAGRKVNDGT